MVNPIGVDVPMFGWKHAPLLAVASQFPISNKYLHTMCNEMDVVIEYIYMSMTEFYVE